MKRKSNYILREVGGQQLIVPTGDEAFRFEGIININETGALLWDTLANDVTENELVSAMRSEYDVDEKTAIEDIRAFVATLANAGLLE